MWSYVALLLLIITALFGGAPVWAQAATTTDSVGVSATILAPEPPPEVFPEDASDASGFDTRCRFGRCLYEDPQQTIRTKVISVSGLTYPGELVEIWYQNKIIAIVRADATGTFAFSLASSADRHTLISLLNRPLLGMGGSFVPVTIPVEQAAYSETRVLLPPPAIALQTTPAPAVIGTTVPGGLVTVFRNGAFFAVVLANEQGYWEVMIDNNQAAFADEAVFTARTTFIGATSNLSAQAQLPTTPSAAQSPIEVVTLAEQPSSTPLFFTPQAMCLAGDVSFDGAVDLADLSVWAYWRGQADSTDATLVRRNDYCVHPNPELTLADVSVIAYYWQKVWADIVQLKT